MAVQHQSVACQTLNTNKEEEKGITWLRAEFSNDPSRLEEDADPEENTRKVFEKASNLTEKTPVEPGTASSVAA